MKTRLAALTIAALAVTGAYAGQNHGMKHSSTQDMSSSATNQAIDNDPTAIRPLEGISANDDTGHDRNSRKKIAEGQNREGMMTDTMSESTTSDQAGVVDESWSETKQTEQAGQAAESQIDSDMDYVDPNTRSSETDESDFIPSTQ